MSAVDNRRKGGHHLYHTQVKALTEGTGRQLEASHGGFIENQAFCTGFARKVNSGILTKAIEMVVSQHIRSPEFGADLHQRIITGPHNRFLKRRRPVTVSIMTGNMLRTGTVKQVFTAITEEAVLRRHFMLIQRCPDGQRFNGGTGFKGITDAEITPYFIIKVHNFFVGHGLYFIFCKIGGQISRVIQIECRRTGHRQNFARIRIGNNNAGILTAPLII